MFKIMDEAIVSGDAHPTEMTSDELDFWWTAGNELLKIRVAYCYVKPRSHLWGVGTWSKACLPSEVRKHGTPEDIAGIPAAVHSWTSKARTTTKRKRPTTQNNRHPRRPALITNRTHSFSTATALSTLADVATTGHPVVDVAPLPVVNTAVGDAPSNDDRSYCTDDLYDEPLPPPEPYNDEDRENMAAFDI